MTEKQEEMIVNVVMVGVLTGIIPMTAVVTLFWIISKLIEVIGL